MGSPDYIVAQTCGRRSQVKFYGVVVAAIVNQFVYYLCAIRFRVDESRLIGGSFFPQSNEYRLRRLMPIDHFLIERFQISGVALRTAGQHIESS
jgi:hypothetical protein